MPGEMIVCLSFDPSELDADIERIHSGMLKLPTVSAVKVSVDGKTVEEIPIFLE